MPFIPAPDTFEIAVHQHQGATLQYVTTFNYYDPSFSPLSQAGANTIADTTADNYNSSGLATLLRNDWGIDEIVVTDLTTASAGQFVGVHSAVVGGAAGEALPPQCAALIVWLTALRGRSYQGRSFIPALSEASSTGSLSAGMVSALNDFAAAQIADFAAGPGYLCVVSRYSGSDLVPLPNGEIVKRPRARGVALSTEIVSAGAEDSIKTQRRRTLPS